MFRKGIDMKIFQCVFSLAAMTALVVGIPPALGQEESAAKTEAARQAFQLLVDGKFDEFYAKCDADVQSNLTLDQLKGPGWR